MLLLFVLLGHFFGAANYWWLTPKGFPVIHARYWANSVAPFVVAAICGFGILSIRVHNRRRVAFALLCIATMWMSGSVAARWIFPISFQLFWLSGFLLGLLLIGIAVAASKLPKLTTLAGIVVSSFLGAFLAWAQRAEEPTTSPINSEFEWPGPNSDPANNIIALDITNSMWIYPWEQQIEIQHEKLTLNIYPVLHFQSISPDRCWTILSHKNGKLSDLTSLVHHEETDDGHIFYSWKKAVHFPANQSSTQLQFTSYRQLTVPVYSHLNTFCRMRISGHQRLSLEFSPCESERIEVLPADYPTGRPARIAYLNSRNQFHVVEATSGEKGPFHRLAAGPLQRDDSLTLSVYDNDKLIAKIHFDDWAAQASTQISPTAGWTLPVNAIEFQRATESPDSTVDIWMTLAGTSVGRGWDSVGHSAGTYRNRVRIELANSQ